MLTSTTVKTLIVSLSALALSACGGKDEQEPVGTDTSSLDAGGVDTGVQGDTDGADTADWAELPDIDDVWTSDDVEDTTEDVTAGDTMVADVPDTAGSSDVPDAVIPLTPFDECVIAEECSTVTFGPVCDTADPDRTEYPNDCYFFCKKKVDCLAGITDGDTTPCNKSYQGEPGPFLDDLAPVASASCDHPCPPEYACSIADSEKQPVCLDGEVTYATPFALCCDTGKTVLDPSVTPGPCQIPNPDCGNCEPPSDAKLVCAQNGQTYGNKCILACEGQLLAYEGPCVPP
jgi:hypothetical protein